jgi:hypothetical protein
MSTLSAFPRLAEEIQAFNARGQLGKDPLAQIYAERRKSHGLFSNLLTDKELDLLRPYLFCYRELPQRSSDTPVRVTNFLDGEWALPAKGELALRNSPTGGLMQVPASTAEDGSAVGAADRTWKSLLGERGLHLPQARPKNFSRMMDTSRGLPPEIRQQIPKTWLRHQKDSLRGKRAADHLEGSAEAAAKGSGFPMLEGHSYWRNPGCRGVSVIISPMNFIWGIPGIHLAGRIWPRAPSTRGIPSPDQQHHHDPMLIAAGPTRRTSRRSRGSAGASPRWPPTRG